MDNRDIPMRYPGYRRAWDDSPTPYLHNMSPASGSLLARRIETTQAAFASSHRGQVTSRSGQIVVTLFLFLAFLAQASGIVYTD
jgi:hypothetical protein